MSSELRRQIYGNLSQKETDELLKIWQTNNHAEWTDLSFEVIHEILKERGIEPPAQGQPIVEIREVVELYKNALASAQKSGDREKEVNALVKLGEVYLQDRQAERAIDFYEQALPLFRLAGNKEREADIHINLSTSNLVLGQVAPALENANKALEISRETANRHTEGLALEIMGQVYFAMGQADKAAENTQSAIDIYNEIGDPGAARARERLKLFTTKKPKSSLPFILVPIALLLIIFFAINPNNKRNLSSSRTIPNNEQKTIVGFDELLNNIPADVTMQQNWEQWMNKYEGKVVKGSGKLMEVRIFPQTSKLFFIIDLFSEGGSNQNNPTKAALIIENAQNIGFGEQEGSFIIDGSVFVYLGRNYSFEGTVSGYSRFDPDLVYSGYTDLIIYKVKMADFVEE